MNSQTTSDGFIRINIDSPEKDQLLGDFLFLDNNVWLSATGKFTLANLSQGDRSPTKLEILLGESGIRDLLGDLEYAIKLRTVSSATQSLLDSLTTAVNELYNHL